MDLQVLLQEVQQLYETEKGGGADLSEDNFVEEISAALAELDDEVNGPQETMDLSPSRRSRVDLSTLDGVMAMASSGSGRSRQAEKVGSIFEEYLTSVLHSQRPSFPSSLTIGSQRLVPFHFLPLHDVWNIRSQTAKHVKEVWAVL